MTETKPRAAIYCRISRDKNGAGLGVQRQEKDCRDLAERLGWEVAGVYTDNDISAYSGKRRPAYADLIQAMRVGAIGGVIAWHTDRLHRSVLELEEYIDAGEAHGVSTHTVKSGYIDLSNPSGRAVARTLGVWARFESEHKAERVSRKKLELAEAGKFGGGPVPYGWHIIDGKPVIVSGDAIEIQKAVRGIINGDSIGSIVKDMNTRGVRTRRGQDWTSTSVRNLVLRPTNAGLSSYRGQVIGKSEFPAIVTEDEWQTASAIVKDPKRRSAFENKVKHLLAGTMLCGTCGGAMQISSRARSGTINRHYYKCTTSGKGHAFQTAAPVEELVSAVVVRRLEDPEFIERVARQDAAPELNELQHQILVLRRRLDESANSFASGAITAGQLETITARVTSELDAATARMAQLGHGSPFPAPGTVDTAAWWEHATVEKKRAVIDALMTLTVMPVNIAAPRRFDPERIQIDWK